MPDRFEFPGLSISGSAPSLLERFFRKRFQTDANPDTQYTDRKATQISKEATNVMKHVLEKIFTGFLIAAIGCGISIAAIEQTVRAAEGGEVSNPSAAEVKIGLEPAFENRTFQNPVVLLQSPDGADTWYVVEQAGIVRYFSPGDNLPKTFANMHPEVAFRGEQGLLGMAFHPAYPDVPYVYLSYTNTNDESIVSRLTLDTETGKLDEGSEQVILRIPQPFSNHNGGKHCIRS